MATLGEMTVKIELSPEVKQELAALHVKLDLLLEKLGEAAPETSVRVNGLGVDLSLLTITDEEREALLIKRDPALRTPYFGETRAL